MSTLNAETIASIIKSRDDRRIGIIDRDTNTMTGLRVLADTSAKFIEELLQALSGAAEALELLLSDPGEDRIRSSSWDKARTSLTTLAPIRELLKMRGEQ